MNTDILVKVEARFFTRKELAELYSISTTTLKRRLLRIKSQIKQIGYAEFVEPDRKVRGKRKLNRTKQLLPPEVIELFFKNYGCVFHNQTKNTKIY